MDPDTLALKEQLASRAGFGLVIDLDETLSATILHMAGELARLYGNPLNLTAEQLRDRMVARDVPFWELAEIRRWGLLALESEELAEAYPIIEGTDRMVAQIDRIVPVVGYLTLRQSSLRAATARWLAKHGFPDVPVITRPDEVDLTSGMRWKADTLVGLFPQVVGLIDDTPDIFAHLPSSYRGVVFHYGAAARPTSGLTVVDCPTWDDVYREVAERREELGRLASDAV